MDHEIDVNNDQNTDQNNDQKNRDPAQIRTGKKHLHKKKKAEWYKLDNAAKIIPSTATGADTRVFRMVCELKEEVDPEVLQTALDRALKGFPYFRSYLRKGIFWYYLESSAQAAVVHEEDLPALKELYIPGQKNLLFRVFWFRKRINMEMYHALADGTGGFAFFRTLVMEYLTEKHGLDRSLIHSDSSSVEEKEADAFRRFYRNAPEATSRNWLRELHPVKAYQLKGEKDPDLQLRLTEGTVSVKEMLSLAHEKNVTIGILTAALYIEAVIRLMDARDYRRPVVIGVPVNLRQFFPSATTRNFFGVINVQYWPEHYDGTLESIVTEVSESFEEQLSREKIFHTMNSYAALEHNWGIKMVPLVIKDRFISLFSSRRQGSVTTSLSNVGKVDLPKELTPYVEKFCGFMACKTVFVCILTFGDHMVFGFVSAFARHSLEREFFRRLTELGIGVEVTGNDYDREVE